MENKKKILIVEDDSKMQMALAEFFSSDGFDVVKASDGEEGIVLAKKENPDIILLDIILPKKDGYEVVSDLKSEETTKNIPVVILTNLGSVNDVEKAIKLGATTYLVKSEYGLEEIVKKVKEIIK